MNSTGRVVGVAFAILYLAFGVLFVSPRLSADGAAYYAQTRSLILDGDGDLADEYAFDEAMVAPLSAAGMREWLPRDYDGRFRHYANIGIVVLFGPFLMAGHLVAVAASQAGLSVSTDGYDLPYVLGVAYGTSALVALGLMALVPFLRKHAGPAVIVVAGASIWLGSSLMWWTAFRPLHAHGASVLLECLFVAILLGRARDPGHRLAWFTLGVIGGLLMTVRPVAAVYQVVPAAWLVVLAASIVREEISTGSTWSWLSRAGRRVMPLVATGALFLLGTVAGRLPQFVFAGDFSLTGSSYYEDSGYLEALGSDLPGGIVSLLLDGRQGVVPFVPIVVIGIVGLAWLWPRDRFAFFVLGAIAALVWGFVALLGYPERFGGPNLASRHLVEATPVYVIGVAGFILGTSSAIRRRWPAVVGGVRNGAWAGTLVAFGIIALATAWGALQHVLLYVAGDIASSPVGRIAALLDHPGLVLRMWDGGNRTGFILVGQIVAAISDRSYAALSGSAIGLVALVASATVALAAAFGVAAIVRADRVRTRSIATAAPLIACVALVAAVCLPAFLAPVDQAGTETFERTSWTSGAPPTDGPVPQVIVGRSAFGNETLAPLDVPADVIGSDPGFTSLDVAPIGEGRSAIVPVPAGWRSLVGAQIRFEHDGPVDGGIDVALSRPGSDAPLVVARVSALESGGRPTLIRLPVRLDGRDLADVEVTVTAPDHRGMPVAVLADGSLAVRLEGIAPRYPYDPTIAPSGMASGWTEIPLPAGTSVRSSTERAVAMRVGPWSVASMLQEAVDGSGWDLPGPRTTASSWTESASLLQGGTGTLDFRVDTPWPAGALSVNVVVDDVEPETEAAIAVLVSTDGAAWRTIGGSTISRRVHPIVASSELGPEVTTFWVRIQLTDGDASAGINGLWFDVALEAAVPPMDAHDFDLAGMGAEHGPVAIDVRTSPAGLSGLARDVATVIQRAVTSLPLVASVGFFAVAAVAFLMSVRRGSSMSTRAGVGGLLICGLILVTLSLPRTSILGRTVAFDAGVGTGVDVLRRAAIAESSGARYQSPTFSLQPGSVVRSVATDRTLDPSAIEIRTVASDGSVGPWVPAEEPFAIGTSEGIQVQVTFAAAGDRLTRIAVEWTPPFGHGPLLIQESGYPRIGG